MLRIAALFIAVAVSAFAMHTAEINVNERDVELQARFDMGQFNDSVMTDAVFLGVNLLFGSEENSDVDTNVLAEVNFLMQRTVDFTDNALSLGMGIKFDYTKFKYPSGENQQIYVLPIGIEVNYRLPFDIPTPLHAGGVFYYAPEVITFGDAKGYMEYRGYFDVEIIQGGRIRAGYRNIQTDIKHKDLTYNKAFYFGFKLAF